ncbi:MAG: hypothetical protein KGP29_04185 [Proteobacteria bacterium]|nr:hypothetical protein [Pseudomonadota bacterium]
MGNDEILKRTEEGMKEGHKVLIREIVRDLEERGITPAWSIDGKIRKLRIANESELEDFDRELKEHGLNKSEFCLLEEDTTKTTPSSIYPIAGNIILIHKKSAKIRTYKAGNSSRWVYDFHLDLKNKLFD